MPDGVWREVYRAFASEGRALSFGELSVRLAISPEQVRASMLELPDRHLLVLNETRDAVRMAHPFSAVPMAFVVTPVDGRDERRWWGGCAWDSFGISAALGLDVLVDTACPGCGRHLRVEVGAGQGPEASMVVRYPRPALEWWSDVVSTCSGIRLFCNRGHAQAWMTTTGSSGELVPAATVWSLAQPWYGDRLAPDYVPHSVEHNQELLAQHGLQGEFWQLPAIWRTAVSGPGAVRAPDACARRP